MCVLFFVDSVQGRRHAVRTNHPMLRGAKDTLNDQHWDELRGATHCHVFLQLQYRKSCRRAYGQVRWIFHQFQLNFLWQCKIIRGYFTFAAFCKIC